MPQTHLFLQSIQYLEQEEKDPYVRQAPVNAKNQQP